MNHTALLSAHLSSSSVPKTTVHLCMLSRGIIEISSVIGTTRVIYVYPLSRGFIVEISSAVGITKVIYLYPLVKLLMVSCG